MRWLVLLALCAAERPRRVHFLAPNATDAFKYPKLNHRIAQLEHESKGYAAQVKGPVMDRADLWLQKKSTYEDAVQVLKKGMDVEGQLLHKLGAELKSNGTARLKAIQQDLEAEHGSASNVSNGSNASNASP